MGLSVSHHGSHVVMNGNYLLICLPMLYLAYFRDNRDSSTRNKLYKIEH